MLTKEKIKAKLRDDPFWEPDEEASEADLELYDEVLKEMEDAGELDSNDNFDSWDENEDLTGDDDY